MRIQRRDIEILKALFACRYLSTSQIQRVFFGKNRSVVCHRLNNKLLSQKIISRHYPNVRFDNVEAVYSLGSEGVKILAQELGVNPLELSRPKEQTFNPLFLRHTLEINDFWISLRSACHSGGNGCELISWWTEKKLRQQFQKPVNSVKRPLPDSWFSLKYSDGSKEHFFLELDRGTERTGVFQRKIQRYLEYYASGQQKEDYGFNNFRVLTVVPDESRVMSLLKVSAEAGANNIFLFGISRDMTPDHILCRIWRTPRDFYENLRDTEGKMRTRKRKDSESTGKRHSIS
ncbi:replication-relaxation family protein [bacterium]|nr:replication-relaxation family protein [bacterium]